jgi:hypothetical protein
MDGSGVPAHALPRLRASALWRAALALNAGARITDAPAALRGNVSTP